MSALPRPNDSSQTRGRGAASLLTDALAEQAKYLEHANGLASRVEEVLDGGAQRLRYVWTTPDSREAEMRVYFQPGGGFVPLAAELASIDDRKPTPGERYLHEREFAAEMSAGGDLWEAVASHVWEQA